jgi:lysophospholipase L1-like esterase
MKLLVLGSSGSAGSGLADPDREAWPWLVQAALEPRFGPIELAHRRYFVAAPGALDYLDEQLDAHQADWVMLQTTAYPLTLRTVAYKISHKVSPGAGKFAERYFNRFDAATRRRGRALRGLNHASHWLAGHAIGRDTQGRYETVIERYTQTIDRIARYEAARSGVMGTGVPRRSVVQDNPSCVPMVHKMNAELRAQAGRRRIPWVDHDAVTADIADHDSTFCDVVHKNALWHRRIAEAVLQVLEPGVSLADTAPAAPAASAEQGVWGVR